MAIEVLLMGDVAGLGIAGDVVRVKDGYARNYLFPKNLAAPVTDATRRRIDKIRKAREEKETVIVDAAKAVAAKIEKASVTIPMKTGSDGKLFGSVTVSHILEALVLQGVPVEKHAIELAEPLKALGAFDVTVKLHPQVSTTLKVWVVEE